MRRKDKLVTDLKLLHEVINKGEVCRLGLVDGTEPYIIPLNYGFDGTNLYFHSAKEGRKVAILKVNNRVCVEFEQDIALVKETEKPCDWGVRYFTVICHGTAEAVLDPDEKSYGLNQIVKHYNPKGMLCDFMEQELSSVLVFKIIFKEMVGKISGMTL